MGHTDNLIYVYQYEENINPLNVKSTKIFHPKHDYVIFHFSDAKHVQYSGMLKID